MAIEDGAILARAIDATDSVASALELYQSNRYERTARVQTGSNDMGELYKLRTVDELTEGFSDFALHENRNDWLYGYNPLTEPLHGSAVGGARSRPT